MKTKEMLSLVRWPNLGMIALLMILLRYALSAPILEAEGMGLLLTDIEFTVLVLSCVLIAAGGYVINDIQDIEIDAANGRQRVLATGKVSNEQAQNLYFMLTFLGLCGGVYLTYIKDYSYIAVLMLVCAGMLYFYSTSYKCIPLLGNLVISGLSALLVYMVVLPEPLARQSQAVMLMITFYMFFSFFTTLIRELLKDLEDLDGDSRLGCDTLPSKAGAKTAKLISALLVLWVIVALALFQISAEQWEDPVPFIYMLVFIEAPLVWLLVLTLRAKEKSDYSKASKWVKITMFTGTISILIFYLNFKLN
jgi:4-hydroxybenzoate polyprenyltransferase